jgi:cation:H+ antiporter
MKSIDLLIQGNILVAWAVLIISFIVLARCAGLFVDSAVAIAHKLKVPQLVIGIVLVSFATTAPELTVSLMSALRGNPEIALGNAVGSVICDDGLALALAAVFSVSAIAVIPAVLKTSGLFLIGIELVAFLFVAFDYSLSRVEGIVLVALFAGYIWFLYYQHKKGAIMDTGESEEAVEKAVGSMVKIVFLFVVAVAGIIIASDFVITSAITIATWFHVPKTVIALTMIALGTSIPEVATCIAAARKKAGAIGVGNIIGADIMNICWVAGASAIANDLTITRKEVYFMFPAMFVIVGSMLIMLRLGYKLTKAKGIVLLGLYAVYLVTSFILFPPH